MTVKQLKTLLADAPDDSVVLTPSREKTFRPSFLRVTVGTIHHNANTNEWTEPEAASADAKPLNAVVIW